MQKTNSLYIKSKSMRCFGMITVFLSLLGVMEFMRFAFIPFKLMLIILIFCFAFYVYIWLKKTKTPFWNTIPLYLYIGWVLIRSIFGMKYANSSFNLSYLIMYVPATFLVCSIQFLAKKSVFTSVIYYWKITLLPCLLFILLLCKGFGIFGFFLCVIQLYLVWIKAFNKKTQVFILLLSFVAIAGSSFFGDPVRASILKYGMALIIGVSCYFRRIISAWMLYLAMIICFIAPIYLLYSAAVGSYSVFSAQEESNSSDERFADTRTDLYVESITSAISNNYVLYGRTPARGYDSNFEQYKNDRPERASEVSIINIFTWYGLLGVILYSFLFLYIVIIGLHKSNNYYVKILSVYLAFRYTMAWIEDSNRFDMVNISLWLMMSICFLPSLRKLTNKRFKKAISFMNF